MPRSRLSCAAPVCQIASWRTTAVAYRRGPQKTWRLGRTTARKRCGRTSAPLAPGAGELRQPARPCPGSHSFGGTSRRSCGRHRQVRARAARKGQPVERQREQQRRQISTIATDSLRVLARMLSDLAGGACSMALRASSIRWRAGLAAVRRAAAILADAPSSPMQQERSPLSVARSETFRC